MAQQVVDQASVDKRPLPRVEWSRWDPREALAVLRQHQQVADLLTVGPLVAVLAVLLAAALAVVSQ